MDLTPFFVFGLIALIIGAQLIIRHKALQARGRTAAPLMSLFADFPSKGKALVYCYSPGCPPCKTMAPQVDRLASTHPHVYKLNISKHMDLAQKLGIRATPTTLIVNDGQICQVLIGQKSPRVLEKHLEDQG